MATYLQSKFLNMKNVFVQQLILSANSFWALENNNLWDVVTGQSESSISQRHVIMMIT